MGPALPCTLLCLSDGPLSSRARGCPPPGPDCWDLGHRADGSTASGVMLVFEILHADFGSLVFFRPCSVLIFLSLYLAHSPAFLCLTLGSQPCCHILSLYFGLGFSSLIITLGEFGPLGQKLLNVHLFSDSRRSTIAKITIQQE